MQHSDEDGMRRRYVTVGDRQVHYWRVGQGEPLVLVHESPRSATTVLDLARRLSPRFCVMALDTPGYGRSDPLELEQPELPDYADALAETLTALGIERCGAYGSHTGAQIALELAARHPARVSAAVLDAPLVIGEKERRDLLASYLPEFPPAISGAHLATVWARFRDQHLFFPWFRREDAARLEIPLPDARELHAGVMDILRAGASYTLAYAAAFRHVVEVPLARVDVPVVVLAREDDLLALHLDRLPELPPSVTVEHLSCDRDLWATRIGDIFAQHGHGATTPLAPVAAMLPRGITRDYCDLKHGQVMVRRGGNGTGRPLVMFHASPGSSAMLVGLAGRLARNRLIVAFDTPGNGDSDALTGEVTDLRSYVGPAGELIESLGLGQVDVFGTHTGAGIAMELAIERPDLVVRAVLDGLPCFEGQEQRALLERYCPSFAPRDDGTHLLAAWAVLRDQTLFWPWFEHTPAGIRHVRPMDVESLNEWFLDLMASGSTYAIAYRAAFSHPTRERLNKLKVPTLMLAREGDPLFDVTLAVAARTSIATAATVPDDDAALTDVVQAFLGREAQ